MDERNNITLHDIVHSGYDENGVFHPVRNVVPIRSESEYEVSRKDKPLAAFSGLLFALAIEAGIVVLFFIGCGAIHLANVVMR